MNFFFPVTLTLLAVPVVGRLGWRRRTYGSWAGSLVKGVVGRTVGEITLTRLRSATETMKLRGGLRRLSDDALRMPPGAHGSAGRLKA